MTTANHTPITSGAAANASTFNTVFAELDAAMGDVDATGAASLTAAIGDLTTLGTTTQSSIVAAIGSAALRTTYKSKLIPAINEVLDRAVAAQTELDNASDPYANLAERLDALTFGYVGGNIATLTNGAADAAQKVVTVDSTTGFLAGAYVAYMLVGGAVEYNVIDTVDSPTQLTLITNIGTGGIADDTYIGMISVSEYQAANVNPHAGSLTLPQAMEYANGGVYNARAYGFSAAATASDNATALQAAIDAAAVGGGTVKIPPGTYALTTVILKSGVTLEGGGCGQNPIEGGIMLGTILEIDGANYGIQLGGDAQEAFINVRNMSIIGTSSGLAGIRLGFDQASEGHYIGNCLIENVWITGFSSSSVSHTVSTGEPPATGGAGVFMPRGITCMLRNVRCQANYYGLYESSNHNSTTMVFDQCSFRENTKYGVRLSDFTHYTFRDCLFESNADSGLAVLPPAAAIGACSGLTLNQCYFENNGDQAGSGTELYQMYIDGATSIPTAYLSRLRMDTCSFNPGDAGADNAVYLANVRHAFLTYNSFGNNTGKIFTVDTTCEGILIITVDPASSSGWIGNTLAAKAVELLMSDNILTLNAGQLRLDTSTAAAPLVIRQASDPIVEQTFLSILRNTTDNVLRITAADDGDAELTMYANGGGGATYIKTGAADEHTFPATINVTTRLSAGSLAANNSAAGNTLGTLTTKLPIYNAAGSLLGYLPIYDAITVV